MTTPLDRVFSKASATGQCLVALTLLVFLAPSSSAAAPRPQTPSGEPIPRYATLKAAPVNARGGPGEDYRALWRYTAKNVPVQIVEETVDWRRVCDPEGGLGWVRASALDGRRTVMRIGASDLKLRARPAEDARVVAMLAARSVADLMQCKIGWCRITVDHATGWVRPAEVWGTAEAPQCRGR